MKKLLPILVIIAACVIFFYPTLTKGLLPVPADTLIGMYHPWLDQAATTNPSGVPFKNYLITDPIRQQIPWRKLVIDDLKRGIFPLWNAYNFSGTQLLSNIQAGVWYPLNIIFLFLPFYSAWTVLIIAQPVLAALFLYLYLRNKKMLACIAAFAAISWAFCGFAVAWLTWGTIVQTALWLPLILLAIDKIDESSSQKSKILWALILAVSSAFALFAGHIQVALYIFVLAGIYGLRKFSWWFLAGIFAAAAISSIQWIPMMQFLSHSSRLADTTAWLKEGWFLPWQNLVQFVAPDFFGNPATLNYWGIWNYGEFIGYIGILPLLFSLYALVVRRDRLTIFFGVFTGIVLLFLLPTPLAKLPFQLHIPVLDSLQPTRLMVLVDFCLVILAALGLDAYVKKPDKRIFIVAGTLIFILLALWGYAVRAHLEVSKHNLILPSILIAASIGILFIRRWKYIMIISVIGLTVFELFRFGWKFTPFTPVDYFFPTTNAVSFLESQQKPFRVMSLDNRIMPPNVNAYYGIESIEGYDPIYDARYEEFVAALNRREPNIAPPFGFNRIITVPTIDSPLLALLNVKYILTLDDIKSPNLELMYREENTRIYFYKKSLPRIYPVESVVRADSRQQVMNMLYDKTFNPTKTAVVEGTLTVIPQQVSDSDILRITSYTDSTLTATTAFTNGHFVVIANMYDSGWKVTVDGTQVPTYRTDYLFIGVQVPKGNHLITVTYE